MSNNLLDIRDLFVEYKSDESGVVKAVNGINIKMNKGETLGLVGETGAGKTTTALSILKLLPSVTGRIKTGEINFNSKDLVIASENDMRPIRGNLISMIFQDPMTSLNPIMTVGDQIYEVLSLHNKDSKKELNSKVDEYLKLVEIQPSRKNEYPHQFSGGMKQRVVIAMALACNPELLIADEPTTALDVTIQAQILEKIGELKDKFNTSMLLITHDLGVVASICDSVSFMYAGEIIEHGTVEQIFDRNKGHHPYTIGLFGSIPDLSTDSDRLNPIPGLMPDPTELPSGCKFHPRCPKCMEICKTNLPKDRIQNGHMIKCHLFNNNNI